MCQTNRRLISAEYAAFVLRFRAAGKSYKEVYEGLGYKKLTESLKAIPDVVQIEGDIVKLKAKK